MQGSTELKDWLFVSNFQCFTVLHTLLMMTAKSVVLFFLLFCFADARADAKSQAAGNYFVTICLKNFFLIQTLLN